MKNKHVFPVEKLYEKYHRLVYQTAYYVCKDRFLAEDIMQETFIKAFKFQTTIEDETKLGAWLRTIATNTAIDFLRSPKWNELPTETLEPSIDLNLNPESSLEQKEWFADLYKQIRKLKPIDQEIIRLKYVKDLRNDEIATLLNINMGAVKSRIFRARKAFKRVWDNVQVS